MKISKLALIALLGGALMAFGCGDDGNGDGGSGGSGGGGGEGGAAGEGGAGGSGGAPVVEPGLWEFTCALSSFDLPVTIKINAADPGFTQGETSDMTTVLDYLVAPDIIGLLPTVAPDAMITAVTSAVALAGGTPADLDGYTVADLPMEPVAEFSSEPLVTAVTVDADATEIALSVTAMSATINGIPETLVPGGVLVLEAGEGDCTALTVVDGSGPLTFDVSGAGGAGGAGGTGGTGGGTPTGNCDYGDCVDPGTERDACETAVGICESTLPPGTAQDVCVEGANVDACGLR
jgi:hypothetical protein